MFVILNPNGASDSFVVLELVSGPQNITQRVLQAFPVMDR
jgi:hypothetical protein